MTLTQTNLNPNTIEVKTCIAATVDCILDTAADFLEANVPFGRYDRINTVRTALSNAVQAGVQGTEASAWALKGQALITLAHAIGAPDTLTTDLAEGHIRIYVLGERDKRKVVRALRRAARTYRSQH